MSYVSIVEKLNAKLVDAYNLNMGEYPTMFEQIKRKKEKILSNLHINVQQHAIYDEGGYLVCFDYTVTINGKHRKLSDLRKGDYWVSDSVLPNGKTVMDCAIVAQHYYV